MVSFREKPVRLVIQFKDEKPIRIKTTVGALFKSGTVQMEDYKITVI